MSSPETRNTMPNAPWGVWATSDAEVVLTPKVLLLYQRMPDCLQSCAYERLPGDGFRYRLRGLSASFWGTDWGAIAFGTDGRLLSRGNADRVFPLLDNIELEIDLHDAALRLHPPLLTGGQPSRVEALETVEPYAAPVATADTVARCLTVWSMGTVLVTDSARPMRFVFVVNTANHWSLYENWESENGFSIYCRCARVATGNSGMVFVQNVKMSVADSQQLNQCFMAEDNLMAAQTAPDIDPAKFDPTQCALVGPEGREWGTIYWSLKELTADRIVLHGCEGKEYVHTRPTGSIKEKMEYFAAPSTTKPSRAPTGGRGEQAPAAHRNPDDGSKLAASDSGRVTKCSLREVL